MEGDTEQNKGGRPRIYATKEEAKAMHNVKRKEWKERNKYHVTCQYCGRRVKKHLLSRHRLQKVCRDKQEELQKTEEADANKNE